MTSERSTEFLACLHPSLVSGKCPQPCRNGGKCIGKSKCKCSKGYQGDLCSKRKYPYTESAWLGGALPTSSPTACCLGITINLCSLTYMFPLPRRKTLYEIHACKKTTTTTKTRHIHTQATELFNYLAFS